MNNATNPTCRQGKIGFPGERAALRAAATMRRNGGRKTASFAYACIECGAWHLTSQSPQTRRSRAKAAWRAVGHRKSIDGDDGTPGEKT